MPQYINSRSIGYTAVSNGAWSSFMNSYAATPFSGSETSGMRNATFSGSTSFTAPASGTYTARAASDDIGSFNIGGTSFGCGGFTSGGNTGSRYYSKGSNVSLSWSVTNSGEPNGDDFATNPCAIAFTVDGPELIKGCTDSRANNYNSAAEEDDGSCVFDPPTASISIDKTWIVNTGDQSATISWSAGGVIDSISVTSVSGPGTSGSKVVSPSSTTTYTITVNGPKQTATDSVTLTVYQLPVIDNIYCSPNPIISGNETSLVWETSGNISGATIDQGIGDVPTEGQVNNLSPTISVTYTLYIYFKDPDGNIFDDTDSVKLTVYQKPTLETSSPGSANYGEDITVEYEFEYANVSATITPQYKYRNANNDGFDIITGDPTNLTPLSTSAEFGVDGTLVTGSTVLSPLYNNDGPFEVNYIVEVNGDGGGETNIENNTIVIDLSPDNITIPPTLGEPNEEPIYSPDPDKFPDTVLEIVDIDIPVEIKSDKPIKVSLDDGNTWLNIREKI